VPEPLLILGASVRALAFSAIRAGFDPVAVDLFDDVDLAGCCLSRRVDPAGYPADLPRLASQAPPGPWMYTGAMENHPEVVDRIAADRPLWGNDGEVLRRVRDPILLAEALRRAALPSLDARLDPAGLPRDGSWLIKPLRSAAGSGIRPLIAGEQPSGAVYFQRRQSGTSGSALFVGGSGTARRVGVTRQRIGREGAPFGYVGSEGPVPVSIGLGRQLDRMGELLAGSFGLRGLFGVDFVLSGGVAWPTEVNPRYTASVEVVEHATGRRLLLDHAREFGAGPAGPEDRGPVPSSSVCKVILHAARDLRVPESHRWPRPDPKSSMPPLVADLPAPGSSIGAGQPVLTLLERASGLDECRRRVGRRLSWWRSTLDRWSTGEG
jgi:predicted ATP-grasp superfamily ATP-dependent carboligase